MIRFLLLLICIGCLSCQPDTKMTANEIIEKAIEKACSGNCESATIQFTFREVRYRSERNGSTFNLERFTTDSLGSFLDVVSNKGFERFKNDTLVKVADTTALKLLNSVNSVHYFAQLPYGLQAPAVVATLLEATQIKGEPYYKVQVTFKEEGGGTDFEDLFVYWIHKKHFTVDYLAYQYEVNGGGMRFREAYNPRVIKGIRFVDYKNYKPADLKTPLAALDRLFDEDKLQLLSTIKTEDITVTLLR